MAVGRNTVSATLILVAAIALVSMLAYKWAHKKETFIEHFYDEQEYALRQAVMNTFDNFIKRKATPKEIERYSSEFHSVDDVVAAIKKDFHVEDFRESVEVSSVVIEEEAVFADTNKFKIVDETPITEPLVPEPKMLPDLPAQTQKGDSVSFERGELRKYVNEMRVFLNYLEARTA